jgi:hypothetical protein
MEYLRVITVGFHKRAGRAAGNDRMSIGYERSLPANIREFNDGEIAEPNDGTSSCLRQLAAIETAQLPSRYTTPMA